MADSSADAVAIRQNDYKVGNQQSSKADALSSLAYRNLLNNSAVPVGSVVPKALPKYTDATSSSNDGNGNGFIADTMNNIGKASQTPVIKQILDALSVGTYSMANYADDSLSGIDKLGKGDLSGILDIASAPVSGLTKGISAATGNKDNVKTFSDVIKHGQADLGLDTENDAAKWTQGLGGFVGDVALDPLTYLTLGVGPAAKGLVTGFKEGGKAAASIATKAVKDAGEVGEAVAPTVQKIADNADKAGLLNKFKEAGVQGVGNYKDWMAQNGGKIAKFELPFTKPADAGKATDIKDVNMAADKEAQLAALVPAKVEEKVPSMAGDTPALPIEPAKLPDALPAKTPEVMAEEKNIVDGITEAAKPAGAPIVDDSIKAPKEPTVKDATKEVIAKTEHENMADILDNVKFSKPVYDAETIIQHDAASKAAIPTSATVAGKFDKSSFTNLKNDLTTNSLKDDTPTVVFGGKPVHPRIIVKELAKAGEDPKAQINVLKRIDPEYVGKFKSASTAEEIPGTPIDYNHPALSGISEEHRVLSTDDLKNLRSSTRNTRNMTSYVSNSATPEELSLMRDKLGLPATASTGDINRKFLEKFKEYNTRNTEALKAATAAKKAEPKNAREAVGEANQSTAQLLEKVPLEQTLIRRANRAITTHEEMTFPINGIKDDSLVNMGDVEKLPQNAMQKALEIQSGKDRPHKMDGGAFSDTVNPTTGTAIYPDKWGTQSMIAMHGSLIRGISDIAKQYAAKSGSSLPVVAKMDLYRRSAKAAMANLRAMGIAPYLDLGKAHTATKGVNLGLDDLSEILYTDMATRFFGGPAKAIQPQAFATGVEALIRAKEAGKTAEQISQDIMHAFTGDKAIYRGQYKDAEGIMRGIDMDATVANIKGATAEGKRTPMGIERAVEAGMNNGKVSYAKAKAAYLADVKGLADKWAKDDTLYTNLNNRMLVNAREHSAELGAMVDRVSGDTLAKIIAAGSSPISSGDFLAEMKKIEAAGKAALGPADETKYLLWDSAMTEARNNVMKSGEQKAVKTATKVSKLAEAPVKETPKTEAAIKVENTHNVAPAIEEAKEEAVKAVEADPVLHEGATKETIDDLYDVHGGAISIDAMRRIHPVASFFNPKFGLDASGMANAVGTGLHTQVRMQSIFHGGVMNYLAKNPDKLMEDWKVIQNEGLLHIKGAGNKASSFMPSTDSAKDLYNVVNSIFDVSKDNIMTRNGLGAKHWNAMAEAKGLKLTMDESKSMLENSRAWLSHEGLKEPKDVLEFLSKAHAVSVNLANDVAIASNFARTFGNAVPKEGHALLAWSKRGVTKNKTSAAGEKSYGFFDLLPKTVYYDKAASRDIANIHRVLNESRSLKPEGAIGSFMNNVFNPITNLMKASQTIVRPGHWVNNTLGDVMRNYLAGVNTVTPYRHALAMMKANGKEMKAFGDNPLKAYEWHRNTTTGDFTVSGKGAGVVVNLGGKPQKINYESLFRIMQDGPIMPKHHGGGVAEDFMQAEQGTLNRFGQTLENVQNKVLDNDHFSLNNLAAARDNFSRISLALDHAMKGKFKDIHELKAAMEEQVLKWVPTSTDFTAREAKYVRPAFMYYTWLRGVTPRIVDTLMNKPGVALGPSKALYEAAKANGIDPMSLGDPFPPNAQMPSYYFDNVIGPLMKGEGQSLWGVNFANPVTDVMDQLGAGVTAGGLMNGSSEVNMGKTLLGAASPFAKIPIDLATQTSNGVPIKDNAQYIQDALGGSYGGLLSKMTGKNITGQGRTDTANGPAHGVDQSDVAKLQIANFLSGLKITDYNSPAAQRSYVGEQKAKASTAKADYRRNQ